MEKVVAPESWVQGGEGTSRGALGAVDRNSWSPYGRHDKANQVLEILQNSARYGAVVIGPWGVGKTALARNIEKLLNPTTHVVRVFGSTTMTSIPYGPLSLLVAKLPTTALETPVGIIHGIADLLQSEANGKKVLLIIDDLPGLDVMSLGVIMHLVISGCVKILVMVRDLNNLPEDMLWLHKDGLLDQVQLEYFSRAEVAELISSATDSAISESAVTALHSASSGIPLVLKALFDEQVANGGIRHRRGVWVVTGPINLDPASALSEIVSSVLARENETVRVGVEKMALIRRAPLSIVISALGEDTAAQMEQRGFLKISSQKWRHTYLTHRYVADIVRGWLSAERKATLLAEISACASSELKALDGPEIMSMAAWSLDAGLVLAPEAALTAALEAVRNFDPGLALRCTAQIPPTHRLRIDAIQARSKAFRILADYQRALQELETVSEADQAELDLEDYCAWAASLCGALLWVDGGCVRIPGVLAAAHERITQVSESGSATHLSIRTAENTLRLAFFEQQIFRGDYAGAIEELESASEDDGDPGFALNCSALLVPAFAATGRELDAVALAKRVLGTVDSGRQGLCFADYCKDGMHNALTWSGLWRESVDLLRNELEGLSQLASYSGGLIELRLGLSYTYAGRGEEAVAVLLAATAQLEVREFRNSLPLAYSALAFAYAQINNETEALRHLALAEDATRPTLWTNDSMSLFFRWMAMRWLDDSQASHQLMDTAREDIAQKRYTIASMSIFGSTIHGSEKDYRLLEEVSLRRQGPMATISVLLAVSCQDRDAGKALEAAALAQELRLDAVESRCSVLALDLARDNGQHGQARMARERLAHLKEKLAVLPVSPANQQVKLTQRELQIAKLAKRGFGNRAIADRIGVSVRTVEGHLYQVYSKLGVTTRGELEQGVEL
ncbi:LuxR C-terminal-related transcriptional regulator [Arthrobacter cryoconiti]|nr:LuxR C-terminal-related transcriptional regulator [Arthrobacter cryoconiti]